MLVVLVSEPTWQPMHLAAKSGETFWSNSWRAVVAGGGGWSSPPVGGVSIPPTQAPNSAIATGARSRLCMRLWFLDGDGLGGLVATAAADEDHGEPEEEQ